MKEKVQIDNNPNAIANHHEVYRMYDMDNKGYEDGERSSHTSKEIKEVKEEQPTPVGFFELFSFSSRFNVFVIIVGILASIGMGVAWPLIILVFGGSTNTLADYQYYPYVLNQTLAKYNDTAPAGTTVQALVAKIKTHDPSFVIDPKYDIMNIMTVLCRYFAGIALGMFGCAYLMVACLTISSQKQISSIRKSFFRAIMRQNIGWFDEQSSGALTNSLVEDISSIHVAIGDKLGHMIQWLSCGIASLILAFVSGWKLTLVTLSVSPLLILSMFFLQMMMTRLNKSESKAYSLAGGIAEEVLGAMRTVVSFRGEKFECERFTKNLDLACKAGVKKGFLTGILMGFFNGMMYASYALGFWYGASLVRSGEINIGSMLIIFFSCMVGSMGFGQALPHINTISKGRISAAKVFAVIKRIPEIDKMDNNGLRPQKLEGAIELQNISFHYPTRVDCSVLKGLSLQIQPGQTVALVGGSGCGKSSIIQLIQRFYDVIHGKILIDGINITALNLMWLREQIGVVSQEPVLFACSIRDNIRYGRLDVTDEEINDALEMANAKNFVLELPDQLDTILGERGAQLSGGQKQRIAIARALVRNPKILLLDEATSALDSESERYVQAALDRARIGRTTIIVAHRLSTIRNADVIFGIKDGVVLESGNHEALISINGLYQDLVERQRINQEEEEQEKVKEKEEIQPENIYEEIDIDNTTTTDKNQRKKSEDVEMQVEVKDEQNYFLRALRMNGDEKGFILLGCIGAIFTGVSQPAFSIIFGYIIPAMANPDPVQQQNDVNHCVIAMACLAVIVFAANVLQSYFFSRSGELLTKHCRSLTFKAMLRQEMAWFDNPENNVGALTTRLSDESSAIRGISGENLGTFFQALACMGTAVIVAFIYTWQISLVIIAFIPFLLLGGILQVRLMKGYSNSDKTTLEESGKIAVESIENIRTVTNLTREEVFIEEYNKSVKKLTLDASKKTHIFGILFALTQATIFCAYSATFILAGYLLQQNETKMTNIFISFGSLIFGAMFLGKSIAMAPDYGKGKVAAEKMFQLFDRVPPIDSYSEEGAPLKPGEAKALVEIQNVFFRYPLRPKTAVLKDIVMDIQPNTTVALVGKSGCGKSTIMQLLQRLYDVNSGFINVDSLGIKTINLHDLRDIFGLVSQEPTLFAYSIRQNIAYADDGTKYTSEQIEKAARAANIHDFVDSLPDKYETMVGEKGSKLSGGQKQRIAIARALLRNPLILLLDEATSALDTESEKIVQDALDKAQEGRTCIVIAHRLSTIQNANKILVFNEGKIEEIGTHQDLINQNGIYSKMVKMQTKH